MQWCLVEAIRDEEVKFLAKAATISLHADERKDRLLILYHAVGGKSGLEVKRGCLGQLRHQGQRAVDVIQSLKKAVKEFCTRRKNTPA